MHIFTGCSLVKEAWKFVNALIRKHQAGSFPRPASLNVEEMVTFTYPTETLDKEIVWILANYFEMVMRESITRGRILAAAGVRGLLRSKLQSLKQRKVGTIKVSL